jgi:hypothetical protein
MKNLKFMKAQAAAEANADINSKGTGILFR